jgi:hypothetical protein
MSNIVSRTVGPKSAKKSLRKAFSSKRPIFLWGPPGIGKSDIIKQLGSELDAHVIDVRLSLWEPTDIKGIPYFDSVDQTMVWAPPSELPSNAFASQFKTVILFLDEMNSAAPSVQAAAYQLILNRRVGQYELPDNVVIVAAGNRETDKGVTYRMPAPLANRFIHLEMAVDWDDYFDWATDNAVHPDVIGFLTSCKSDLYTFDSKSSSRAFATPRSWSFVSELINDNDTDADTLSDLVAGSIGEGLAIKFMAHRQFSSKLPNPTAVLNGKVTTCETKEISAMYSLTISLCYELKESARKKVPNWNEQVNNYFLFMMNNFETEIAIMGTKLALCSYKLPLDPEEISCFDEFHGKYGKYITAASGQ